MRTLSLIFLSIILNTTAFSQVIKGTIFEKDTNTPVCFATIYFNGTFVGTSSDQNGNFELDISKNKSMPLTISAIGYYSVSLTNFSEIGPLKIYLHPKNYVLKDAVISAKSLARKRKRNLRLFKEEFIGTTENAKKCEILNEEDISFNYYSDDDTIKAYALKPIRIENKALGYKITYYLDKFEYYKRAQATFFCGNIIFNEDLTNDETQMQYYKKRRQIAYFGSRMHFIRALWSDHLNSSGYKVKDPTYKRLKERDIVFEDDWNNKFLTYHTNLYVEFYNRKSIIEFIDDSVYFEKTGFFNPGINWKGEMGKQRVADWLPYEYKWRSNKD